MTNSPENNQTINILLCEDNPGDVFIIRHSLSKSKSAYNFYHTNDGENAMAFLRHEGEYQNVPDPDLLLLDLNLPKKEGFEVLEEIKTDSKLKLLPVVILTSSSAKQDILKSYDLYASCYVTKPFDFNEFVEAVKKIESFWLNFVQLPKFVNNN
ncbi:MAG: response regulator [Symploca sp. SIO2E9]|nr:response regulator [Symploca sp. SIO2E9]